MTGKSTSAAKAAATLIKTPAADPATGQDLAAPQNAQAIMPPPNAVLQLNTGAVLTVGAGMEFATLAAALKASVNGDTIAVKAGTYVNDFCVVSTNVSIVAMGGMVNEVATVEPPNGKGLIVADADLNIRGFSFTGGSDGSPDGNVSGIRYEQGNLNVAYCDFHDMEEGLLATPGVVGTGNITIDHSEFSHNGSGDGYSHDIYVGAVASFTLTNSYIHDAIVGHEVKSRAAVTTIVHNVIADGPTGTGSYDIDIPNAGVARISDNVIEKGPDASNVYAIHYGGEDQYAWAQNSLTINHNTIIDDYGPGAVAVLNQSSYNGLSVAAKFVNNTLYGFTAQNIVMGAGHIRGLTMLSTDPGFSARSPWTNLPGVSLSKGTERLVIKTFGNVVGGGANLLAITDTGGNNSITGGAGGLQLVDTAGWDHVTTQAGATDALTLDGRNNTVTSAGHDTIVDNGTYDEIDATGNATIAGNSFASYNLAGTDAVSVGGAGSLHVLATGRVTATIAAAGVSGEKDAGGLLAIGGTGTGAAGMQATIAGGSASFDSNNGANLHVAGQHGALAVTLGAGAFNITGGDGNDQFATGSGTATLTLGAGTDSVVFGSGSTTVQGGSGADSYTFDTGAGSATIEGFKQGIDTLTFWSNAIASGVISGGSTVLTLSDGAVIDIAGVQLPGYVGPGGTGGGGTGGGTTSGAVTLTSGGHNLIGNSALLAVADLAGGNTIAGGTGGLTTAPIGYDVLSTAAGSTNRLALTGSDTLTGSGADQVSIGGTYDDITENAAATVSLSVYGNTVHGGAGLLTVADNFGGNTLAGGAGGLDAVVTGASDVISTLQGATDSVSVSGYSTLTLAGRDQVSLSGNYNVLTATGTAVITANGGWSSYTLDGTDTLQGSGAGVVTIGEAATATLISTGAGGSAVTKMAGGTLHYAQQMADGSSSSITVAGGAATASSSGGNYAGITVATGGAGDSIVAGGGSDTVNSAGPDTVWAGAGALTVNATGALRLLGGSGSTMVTAGAAGVSIQGGSGNITLTGGTGNDSFAGGTGSSTLWLGSGADSVTFGAGAGTIHAGSNDVFTAISGMHGSDTITGFGGNDTLVFQGFGGNAIASETVSGGNSFLTLTDGASIELVGVSQLPHFG